MLIMENIVDVAELPILGILYIAMNLYTAMENQPLLLIYLWFSMAIYRIPNGYVTHFSALEAW